MAYDQYGNYYYDPATDGPQDPSQQTGTDTTQTTAPPPTDTSGMVSNPDPTVQGPSAPQATSTDPYASPPPSPYTGPVWQESGMAGTGTSANGSGSAPSYVNMSDPIAAAVWQAYQQKGITPRDQGDFQYWVDKINQTGGWTPQNSAYWLSRMAQASGGVGDYSGAPESGSAGTSGFASPYTSGTSPVASQGSTQFGSAYDPMVMSAIQQLLTQGQTPVSANDPNIAAATGAYKTQQTQAQRDDRSAMAERAASEGLDPGGAGSGAFDSSVESGIERAGQNTAAFSANLVLDEIKQRRQDVVNALTFAQGEQRNQLQIQLAQLNDQLQRAQLQQQYQEFQGGLGYQYNALGQQNNQFYDTYGQNAANQQAQMDYLYTALGLR